jgi:methyl-accepting chemotaxis protein
MERISRSLGWKMGASFGALVVLLGITAGSSIWSVRSLESVQSRTSGSVTPKLLAADALRSAATDQHFSQTQWVFQDGAGRADFLGDHHVFERALTVLRARTATAADRRALARIQTASSRFDQLDRRMAQAISAGRFAAARAIALGAEDETADALAQATTGYQQESLREQQGLNTSFRSTASRADWVALGLAGAAILAAIALTVWLTRTIVGGIRQTLAAAEGIARGDVDQHIDVTSRDEVGQMAAAFEDMIGYLHEVADAATRISGGDLTVQVTPRSPDDVLGTAIAGMIANLRELIGTLGRSSGSLREASDHMSGSAGEAGAAVASIAEAVGDVAAGAERQVRMVGDARHAAEATAIDAGRARALADGGVSAANEASRAMRGLQDSSTELTAAIEALNEKSGRIGGIVDAISSIAGQTNLLALNAAIEAARAGEQGRGFAVVAEEVRKLAGQAQASAEQIAQLIAEIQSDTERTVTVVRGGAERTQQGVEVVERTRGMFEQIGQGILAISGRVDAIASATGEVAAVAEQSAASAQEVSATTEQTSAATQHIAASAHSLAATAQDLDGLVRRFRLSA